jgi:hypothetical protein
VNEFIRDVNLAVRKVLDRFVRQGNTPLYTPTEAKVLYT